MDTDMVVTHLGWGQVLLIKCRYIRAITSTPKETYILHFNGSSATQF